MHELPVINSILKVVLKHAAANQVTRVLAVHLQVGELCDLEEKWMQDYFDYLSKGGVAEGARLVVERTPVVMKCSACGASFTVERHSAAPPSCPVCKGEKYAMISGREYFIKNMEAV